MYMKFVLSLGHLITIQCRLDALYGVHPDCKGHTKIMMSMAGGSNEFHHRVEIK